MVQKKIKLDFLPGNLSILSEQYACAISSIYQGSPKLAFAIPFSFMNEIASMKYKLPPDNSSQEETCQ